MHCDPDDQCPECGNAQLEWGVDENDGTHILICPVCGAEFP